MTAIIFILFTLIGIAVIVMVLGGFRGEFLTQRIDCEDPCTIGEARCEGAQLHECAYDDSGCPVRIVSECANGCEDAACIP